MTNPQVLCLGEILWDYLADQPGRPLAEVTSWTPYLGGAPANVACGLSRLGTPAGLVGCVGEDTLGAGLIEILESFGVDLQGLQRHPSPTRQVYVTRSEDGERTFAGFSHPDPGHFADTHLAAGRLPEPLFREAQVLLLGTLELAFPDSRVACFRGLDLAERHYLKVLLDINWRPVFWADPAAAPALIHQVLGKTDFLKLTEEEAEWLFGTRDPGAIAHRHGNLEGVMVTAGRRGCRYCVRDYEGEVPAFPVQAVDTTGAGDAFIAGFLHQLICKELRGLDSAQSVREAMTYACTVGALSTRQPGAVTGLPTDAEVTDCLQRLAGSGEAT